MGLTKREETEAEIVRKDIEDALEANDDTKLVDAFLKAVDMAVKKTSKTRIKGHLRILLFMCLELIALLFFSQFVPCNLYEADRFMLVYNILTVIFFNLTVLILLLTMLSCIYDMAIYYHMYRNDVGLIGTYDDKLRRWGLWRSPVGVSLTIEWVGVVIFTAATKMAYIRGTCDLVLGFVIGTLIFRYFNKHKVSLF